MESQESPKKLAGLYETGAEVWQAAIERLPNVAEAIQLAYDWYLRSEESPHGSEQARHAWLQGLQCQVGAFEVLKADPNLCELFEPAAIWDMLVAQIKGSADGLPEIRWRRFWPGQVTEAHEANDKVFLSQDGTEDERRRIAPYVAWRLGRKVDNRGRRPNSGYFNDADQFRATVFPIIRQLHSKGRRVTKEQVAEFLRPSLPRKYDDPEADLDVETLSKEVGRWCKKFLGLTFEESVKAALG